MGDLKSLKVSILDMPDEEAIKYILVSRQRRRVAPKPVRAARAKTTKQREKAPRSSKSALSALGALSADDLKSIIEHLEEELTDE